MIVIINSMHYSKPLNKYTRHRYLPGLAYFFFLHQTQATVFGFVVVVVFNHSSQSHRYDRRKSSFTTPHQDSDAHILNQISQQVQS